MHYNLSATRILIVLLVLRMLAAPVALPDSSRTQAQHPLIVRVCAWPVHRPKRLLSPYLPVKRFRGGWDDVLASLVPVAATRARAREALVLARARALRAREGAFFVHVHLSDCARC
jgi:hypothetical protein